MKNMMRVKSILVVVAIIVASTSVSNGVPVEWSVDEGGNGHFYEAVLVEGGIWWGQAALRAYYAEGRLATITSAEENEFVYNLISDSKFWYNLHGKTNIGPWIGGGGWFTEEKSEGYWYWVNLNLEYEYEPFIYTNCIVGQPADTINYEFHEMFFLHYYSDNSEPAPFWNYGNRYLTNGYIVEYNRYNTPEPCTLLLLGLGGLMLRKMKKYK